MKPTRPLLIAISLIGILALAFTATRLDVISAFIIRGSWPIGLTPAPAGQWTMDAIRMTDTQALDNTTGAKHGTLQGYELTSCSNIGWVAETNWNFPDIGWSSSPAFGDLDGDGDFDALVGSKDSAILGYKNIGSASSPTWDRQDTWDINTGGGTDTYPAPELADIDNDGDLDLFMGNNKAVDFKFYRNTGSASSPVWSYYNAWRIPNDDSWNAPALGDLDGDGDLDAMGGTAWGQVEGYINSGTKTSPLWEYFTFWDTEKMESMTNKQPALTDLDKDGDLDLLIGGNDTPSTPGYVLAYRNTWNGSGPVWTRWPAWDPPTNASAHAQPGVADLDGDGDDDVVVGYTDGFSRAYKNTGTCVSSVSDHLVSGVLAQALQFDGIDDRVNIGATGINVKTVSLWVKADDTTNRSILALNGSARITLNASGAITTTGFTSPTIYIDGAVGSQLPDSNWHFVTVTTGTAISATAMTLGLANGSYFDGALDDVQIYTQTLTAGEVAARLAPLKTMTINSSAVQTDDTGLVLHYSFNGSVTDDSSTGDSAAGAKHGTLNGGTITSCSPAWKAKPEWNTPSAGGASTIRYAMPDLADLDGDDDLDLMIGTTPAGPFAFINVGTATVPTWSLKTAWNLPHPDDYENPEFVDLDNDGDYDVMMGDKNKHFTVYRNTGTTTSPVWTLQVGWDLPDSSQGYTNVTFGDLDNDGDYDAMHGHGWGDIIGYRNTGTASAPVWSRQNAWDTTMLPDTGQTHKTGELADLDFDGDLDLMYGTNEGNIYVLQNTGSKSSPTWTLNNAWRPTEVIANALISLGDLDNDGDMDLLRHDPDFPGARALAYENIGQCQQGGLITPTPGKLGQALAFDGTNDYVSVGNTAQTVNSISFWIQADDTTSRGIMALNGTANISLNASSQITTAGFTSPTIYINGIAGSTLPDTGWHHVTITTATGISVSALEIGRVGTSYFDGALDDVRMYNRVLNAATVPAQKKLGEVLIDPNL